jgi:SPP1 gp7 family putative phage head morphogenesis protein
MDEKEYIAFLLNLPPEEIIRWYESKGYAFSWKWQDVWQSAHTRTFTVAKVMKLDILQAIKKEVDNIFKTGITFEQFQKNIEPTLKRLGWWDKVKAKDVPGYVPSPDIDPEKIVQLGSPKRLKTIYQTNSNVANNAGRWNTFAANNKTRPLLKYHQLDRENKRKSHEPFAGKIFYWDDPIWKIIAPPNGWGCGCYLTSHTLEEAINNKWKISKGEDFMKKAFTNVDEEWQYNPGDDYANWQPDLTKYDDDIKQLF